MKRNQQDNKKSSHFMDATEDYTYCLRLSPAPFNIPLREQVRLKAVGTRQGSVLASWALKPYLHTSLRRISTVRSISIRVSIPLYRSIQVG